MWHRIIYYRYERTCVYKAIITGNRCVYRLCRGDSWCISFLFIKPLNVSCVHKRVVAINSIICRRCRADSVGGHNGALTATLSGTSVIAHASSLKAPPFSKQSLTGAILERAIETIRDIRVREGDDGIYFSYRLVSPLVSRIGQNYNKRRYRS